MSFMERSLRKAVGLFAAVMTLCVTLGLLSVTFQMWQEPPQYLVEQSTTPLTLDIAFASAALLIGGVGMYITRNQYRWSTQSESARGR